VSINNSIKLAGEKPFELELLNDHFTKLLWPEVHEKVETIRARPAAKPPERSERDLLVEVLESVRELSRRPNTAGIQDKTLQLVKEIYRGSFNAEPPSLKALHQHATSPLNARVAEALKVDDLSLAITPGYLSMRHMAPGRPRRRRRLHPRPPAATRLARSERRRDMTAREAFERANAAGRANGSEPARRSAVRTDRADVSRANETPVDGRLPGWSDALRTTTAKPRCIPVHFAPSRE
jgi:hypothetical protein